MCPANEYAKLVILVADEKIISSQTSPPFFLSCVMLCSLDILIINKIDVKGAFIL